MKNLEKYLTEVKKGIPDIEQKLNGGAVRKYCGETMILSF